MKKPHEQALDSMFDDMDSFESKKMFGEPESPESKGVSITISVSPPGEISTDDMAEAPVNMNKGGMAKDCYSEGGVVEPVEDDLGMPPFLRKKKKSLNA